MFNYITNKMIGAMLVLIGFAFVWGFGIITGELYASILITAVSVAIISEECKAEDWVTKYESQEEVV